MNNNVMRSQCQETFRAENRRQNVITWKHGELRNSKAIVAVVNNNKSLTNILLL